MVNGLISVPVSPGLKGVTASFEQQCSWASPKLGSHLTPTLEWRQLPLKSHRRRRSQPAVLGGQP
jgi:hypothetical protein